MLFKWLVLIFIFFFNSNSPCHHWKQGAAIYRAAGNTGSREEKEVDFRNVFDDKMLGSWSDEGYKTLTETGAENKTKIIICISWFNKNSFNKKCHP